VSRRRDDARAGDQPTADHSTATISLPAAPVKHPRQLFISSLLMIGWILFLAWMAWYA
jgi:hypothetical protein